MSKTLREWRPVIDWPNYAVSDDGLVFSFAREGTPNRMLKQTNRRGYRTLMLYDGKERKTAWVHRLVLEAFVGPRPAGQQSRHLNGIRHDNRLTNLAWGTGEKNQRDRLKHGTDPNGERNGCAKLSWDDVRDIRRRHVAGETQNSLAATFGVTRVNINYIVRGKTWRVL